LVKQFAQSGTRLQPIVGLHFAAGRDHAAYDTAHAAAESILLKPSAVCF